MDNYISVSLRLEKIFEYFGNKKISRDQIVSRPTEAIRDGLTWLNGLGVLTQEDVSDWRMRYDFDDLSLEKVFENDITKDAFMELINQLQEIYKVNDESTEDEYEN